MTCRVNCDDQIPVIEVPAVAAAILCHVHRDRCIDIEGAMMANQPDMRLKFAFASGNDCIAARRFRAARIDRRSQGIVVLEVVMSSRPIVGEAIVGESHGSASDAPE